MPPCRASGRTMLREETHSWTWTTSCRWRAVPFWTWMTCWIWLRLCQSGSRDSGTEDIHEKAVMAERANKASSWQRKRTTTLFLRGVLGPGEAATLASKRQCMLIISATIDIVVLRCATSGCTWPVHPCGCLLVTRTSTLMLLRVSRKKRLALNLSCLNFQPALV